jgi:hypothetical protein
LNIPRTSNTTSSARERAQRRIQIRRSRQRASNLKSLAIISVLVVIAGGILYSPAGLSIGEALGIRAGTILEPPTTRAEYVTFTIEAIAKATEYFDRGKTDINGKLVGVDIVALSGLMHPIMAGPELMLTHLASNDLDACDDLVDAINGSLYEIRDIMAEYANR